MNSTPNPDPHDVAIAALKEACRQIGPADDRLAGLKEQVSRSEQDAAGDPLEQQKRAAVLLRRSLPGRLASMWLIGLTVVAGLFVAAFAWQSYGDAAKQIIARWAPERVLLVKQEPPAEPRPPTAEVTAAVRAPPQLAPPAQTTPQHLPPTAAPIAPELAQWLQETGRDLVDMEQGIKQLKASQDQMLRDNAELAKQLLATQAQIARDNAALTEQLKTALTQIAHDNAAVAEQLQKSQEQIASVIAKASEENARPKISAPPPQSTATPRRKPMPKRPSQARAQPQVPKPEQQ